MLVSPRRVSARLVDDSENRIGAHEVPRVNRQATAVTLQALCIDRRDSPIRQAGARRAAVQKALIDVYTFIELGGGSRRRSSRCARTARYPIARGHGWRV